VPLTLSTICLTNISMDDSKARYIEVLIDVIERFKAHEQIQEWSIKVLEKSYQRFPQNISRKNQKLRLPIPHGSHAGLQQCIRKMEVELLGLYVPGIDWKICRS
jgi:hypothetical protein